MSPLVRVAGERVRIGALRLTRPRPDVDPRGVVAGDGQPGQGRPDHRTERQVERLGPLGQPGQDLRTADDDLDREQDRRADRQPDQRRVVTLGAPGDDGQRRDDDRDERGDPAMEGVGGGHVGDRRDERPVHQGPVGEDQGRGGRGHLRAEQQQREGDPGRERGEEGEPLARAPPADPGRVPGAHGQEDEQRDERERRGEVRRHRLSAVAQPDRLASQPRLEPDQRRPPRATATGWTTGRGSRGSPGRQAPGSRSR